MGGGLLVLFAVAALGVSWMLATASGTRWLVNRLPLPAGLTVARVEGSVWRGLELRGVHYLGESFEVETPRIALTLRAQWQGRALVLSDWVVDDLRLVLHDGEAQAPSPDLEALLANAALPVPLWLEPGRVAGIHLVLADGSVWTFDQLRARGRWGSALQSTLLQLDASWLQARLAGDLALGEGRTDLALEATVDARRWSDVLPPDLAVSAVATERLDRLELTVSSATAALSAKGGVDDPFTDPVLELQLALADWTLPGTAEKRPLVTTARGELRATPRGWSTDLEGVLSDRELPSVHWRLDAAGVDEGLAIEALALRSELGEIDAAGTVRWGESANLDLALDWRRLRWPAGDQPPRLSSAEGQGRLSGNPDDWRFLGGFLLASAGYPEGRVELQASGDRERAVVDSLQGAVLGGTLEASGTLGWSGTPRLDARIRFDSMDTAVLVPEWPAELSGAVEVDAVGGEQPAIDLAIERLAGRFHGEKLSGAGRLAWRDQAWSADDIRLTLGPTSLTLAGELDDTARLDLELDIRQPGWVARQLGGEASGTLRIDTGAAFPVLAADLQAAHIDVGGLRLDALDVSRVAGESRVVISARDLWWDERSVDRLDGELLAGDDDYRLHLAAVAGELLGQVALDGRITRGEQAGGLAWHGRLVDFRLQRHDRRILELAAPAEARISRDAFLLDDACFTAGGGGRICTRAEGRPGAGGDLDLALHSLPLGLLRALTDHDVRTTQRLDGKAEWHWGPDSQPTGSAAIDVSPGEVGRAEDDSHRVRVGAGFIGFQLAEGNLEGGRIELPLAGAGHVRAEVGVTGVNFDGSGRVSGTLDLDLRDLSVLQGVVGGVDEVRGTLRSTIRLGGTVADPVLDGTFDLAEGAFEVPLLGARVENLVMEGRVDRADRLELGGRFMAGEGTGRVVMMVGFSDLASPQLDARVRGNDLAVARLPDLEVDADPDLHLAYVDDAWRLEGEVVVPRARVTPLTSFVTRVDESADVVVVAGARNPRPAAADSRPAQLTGQVALRLADDVRLEMDMASLALGGGVDMAWNGSLVPMADGQITVNGTITAWGPRLVIDDGRVRWSDEVVTNPSLDLRAERDVFGNTLVRTVGVRVTGTAKRPDIDAYTRPLTTSERAWAVLVTGSDVNYAQGVGAVDVGTYIAPRIFLSYGISLFDSENVVGLRYDLKRGWGIKATSGQKESGVDLSYTIED